MEPALASLRCLLQLPASWLTKPAEAAPPRAQAQAQAQESYGLELSEGRRQASSATVRNWNFRRAAQGLGSPNYRWRQAWPRPGSAPKTISKLPSEAIKGQTSAGAAKVG